MRKVKVRIAKKSKLVSIRKCPWDPWADKEITRSDLKPGDPIRIDEDSVVYDWRGAKYYEAFDYYIASNHVGYINAEAVEY